MLLAEGRRFELLCPAGAAVFGTAGLPFAHPFRVDYRARLELAKICFADRRFDRFSIR
jgi:hypothetical protein